MRALFGALALSFIAWPALADPPEGEPQASAGALGLELIADAGAEGVFETLPSPPRTIVVRHARSGLVCRMDVDHANRLLIFPRAARGEDVACETSADGETVVLFATRFSFDTTLDEQIRGAEAAIMRHYPDAQPYAATIALNSDTLPAHRSAAFVVTRDGARTFTSASVAQVGEWVIKLRYTTRAPDDAAARAAAGAASRTFGAALEEIVAQRE